MSDTLYEVALKAAELKLAARPQFDQLLLALLAHETKLRNDLVAAGPANIFEAQGAARAMGMLNRKLEDCIQIAQKRHS